MTIKGHNVKRCALLNGITECLLTFSQKLFLYEAHVNVHHFGNQLLKEKHVSNIDLVYILNAITDFSV